MDDTQQSRASDAGASRKRRSSILKLQRAPRAPFSELEFNVGTPTDSSKSRRVSFSRRTGVAEFVTNEATTTWKNFYEEHNKTLESSGNDSEVKPPRPSVGHIGKSIFDQFFQEVEAVDLVPIIGDGRGCTIETSMNNINFAEQFAALETTSDGKLTAPHHIFELSAFTDNQTKVFGEDLGISSMGEMSDRISVNFSQVHPIGEPLDDLDAIQRDLQMKRTVVGPSGAGRDISEYIEIDLNMTSIAMRNDESDMSITDTIHSPKVQDVSKSSVSIDKKSSLSKDWVADKENILVNPYATPKESLNFAINEEDDKILVFDGKRLTIQSEKDTMGDIDYRKTLLPNSLPDQTPQRKTILFNIHDDLPNLTMSQSIKDVTMNRSIANWDQPKIHLLGNNVEAEQERKTVFCDNDAKKLSVIQNVPGKIILLDKVEKRRSNVYETDSADISVTQAVSSNIILGKEFLSERRKTIVYADDAGDISVTQAVPTNIVLPSKRDIVFETDCADISVTQAVSTNIMLPEPALLISDKRKTIVYDDDAGDISITQAVPKNIVLSNKRDTFVFETDSGDVSVTQAIPTNIILHKQLLTSEKRKTIVYDDEAGDISITHAVPKNIVLANKRDTIVFKTESGDISLTQDFPTITEIGKTIVYDDAADISITQAVPQNIVLPSKRHTIIFETNSGDISVTEAIPSNIMLPKQNSDVPSKMDTGVSDTDSSDISVTETVPSRFTLPKQSQLRSEQRRTIVFEDDIGNLSLTQAVPTNLVLPENLNVTSGKEMTVYETESKDISVTQAVPSNIIWSEKDILSERRKTIVYEDEAGNISMTQSVPSNLILGDGLEKRKTIVHESDSVDVSAVIQPLESDLIFPAKHTTVCHKNSPDVSALNPILDDDLVSERKKTIVYEDNTGNISNTLDIPSNLILPNEDVEKTRTIVYETDSGNISVTETISANIVLLEKRRTIVYDSEVRDVSTAQMVSGSIQRLETETVSNKNIIGDNYMDCVSNNSMSISLAQHPEQYISMAETDMNRTTSKDRSQRISLEKNDESEKRKTIMFENDLGNISIVKPISSHFTSIKNQLLEASKIDSIANLNNDDNCLDLNVTSKLQQNVIVYQANIHDSSSYATITSNEESKPKFVESKGSLQTREISTVSAGTSDSHMNPTEQSKQKTKTSILDDLLDMSHASMEGGIDDKCIMALIESKDSQKSVAKTATESDESMFFVTKDNEDEAQTDKQEDTPRITNQPTLQTENKEHERDLPKPLQNFENVCSTLPENRHFEKVQSSDIESKASVDKGCFEERLKNKTFIDSNNTRDLLAMISDFTDKEEEANPIEDEEEINEPQPIVNQLPLTRRLSFATKRQSIVISREDLLNNISMAQAVLQNTRVEFDDDESANDTTTTTPVEETGSRLKKCVRMSNDVAKTLHFDDSTFSNVSIKSDTKMSPLKKTTFGEKSYMRETPDKARVIPTFLKDVSDNVKQLMIDLVKPINEAMPFETSGIDKEVKKATSTCSLQVQTSLNTSSQIDIDSETNSNPLSAVSGIADSTKGIQSTAPLESKNKVIRPGTYRSPTSQVVPGRVLVFDPSNPVNNILFQPMGFTEAHKYDPLKVSSYETLTASEHSETKVAWSENENGSQVLSTQFLVNRSPTPIPFSPSAGDACCEKVIEKVNKKESEVLSVVSNVTEAISIHNSVDTPLIDFKNVEVNTAIIMKENKELLESNSSLTLVDDALERGEFDVDIDTQSSGDNIDPVNVLYNAESTKEKVESNEGNLQNAVLNKGHKRNYSPAKPNINRAPVDYTPPKPSIKMPKLTNSPNVTLNRTSPESHNMAKSPEIKKRSPKKKKLKVRISPKVKEMTIFTEQQSLIESPIIKTDTNKEAICTPTLASTTEKLDSDGMESDATSSIQSVDAISSVTSSNRSIRDDQSATTMDSQGKSLPMDWHPELLNELSSKNLVTECESSVNVVAKIDMLPFMGSRECEWEASESDSWAFRLLRGRLRLTVRFAPRVANSVRSVRADTPVINTTLDTFQGGKNSAIAVLCVRFAAEAMRYFMASECERAGDVPALLRRCAGVACVALRWGRAMREAELRLAFRLTEDGGLALKVANIPLRSVWEVTMRLEMTVSRAREAPWPRAAGVRVAPVLAQAPLARGEVERATRHVREDWGHVPRTIWKIFRHLKNKTRDDDLFLGL